MKIRDAIKLIENDGWRRAGCGKAMRHMVRQAHHEVQAIEITPPHGEEAEGRLEP
jgi:hypothetical protein